MAEAVLFTLTNDILKLAGSDIFLKIQLVRGARDDLSRLTDTVKTIQAVLLDAEKQQRHSHQVKLWLERLKDVLYDAQDLLDDVATEDLRRNVTPRNKMWKPVCAFFSKSNQLAQSYRVTKKIREIRKTLDCIANDENFHLKHHPNEATVTIVRRRTTDSFVRKEEIIGRQIDTRKIIESLLDYSKKSVLVVSIVGMGGLGKTTLAGLVYNDDEVTKYFTIKMWVCVSDVFDVDLVIKEILKSARDEYQGDLEMKNILRDIEGKSMDHLRKLLRKVLDGKIYLLVLDDLWNQDRLRWLDLQSLLMGASRRSKILVTTRNKSVVHAIDVNSVIHDIDVLSEDESWDLLKKTVFGDGEESLNQKLEEIGGDILKKCGGVPLAIKTIGNLLYAKEEKEWLYFKECEFSKIDTSNYGIMEVLKISYDHLQPNLKHCFAYCSLFPKGYVYEANMMIHLWVAQGFIESCNEKDDLEVVAENYLSELICRSFLKVESTIIYGNIHKVKEFKVHDLMHDLARKVAGGECKTDNSIEGDNDRVIRHASFISETFSKEKVLSLLKISKLRTFLSFKGESSARNCRKVFSSCGHCRALYLDYTDIPLPPSSLGKLKKLRFLHIFMNQSIQSLPDSISDLVNLQTLKLSSCEHLQTFPRDLRKLVKLRHLLICCCESLSQLPPLSELPSLKTLHLESLNALKFVQQTSDPEPSNTTLPFFQSLESLEVFKCRELKGWWGRMQEMGAHQKHRLDNSWSSFPKLSFMHISGCPHLSFIPSFPQVEYLLMDDINMLEQQLKGNPNYCKLRYLDFGGDGGGGGNPESFTLVKRLASNLEYMGFFSFHLRILTHEMQHLSLLKELHIWKCHGTSLSCQEDEHGTQWQCLKNLRVLTIGSIYDSMALPEGIQHVTTLQSLHISNMPYLIYLPEWIGNLSLLEELELLLCISIKYIPSKILDLTRLKKLTISGCLSLKQYHLFGLHSSIFGTARGLFGRTSNRTPNGPLIAPEDDSSDSD